MERAKTFFGRDHEGYVGREEHTVSKCANIDFILMNSFTFCYNS